MARILFLLKEEIALGAILTQRTNWRNVEKALANLKSAKALSIKGIYQLGKQNKKSLENLIRPSGFYKQKAKRIYQQLFQKNLPRDTKIYQDFHAMIVLEGRGTSWDLK